MTHPPTANVRRDWTVADQGRFSLHMKFARNPSLSLFPLMCLAMDRHESGDRDRDGFAVAKNYGTSSTNYGRMSIQIPQKQHAHFCDNLSRMVLICAHTASVPVIAAWQENTQSNVEFWLETEHLFSAERRAH